MHRLPSAGIGLVLTMAVLLATGCDRKLTTSLQHVAFEGDSIRVHFQHTETYDYLPVSLCMHGCKPDVRKVRFGQAWRPATTEGEWRYVEGGDASVSSPEAMVSSLRVSGLVRWRGDAPACPGFYGAHGVPEVIDCQRSTFRVASNDGRLTLWDAHLTGPWRGEPNTAPHGLLIEADARQRRSVDLLPRRWRTAQAEGCAAAIAARDAAARAAGDLGLLDEQSVLAQDGGHLLVLYRPSASGYASRTDWWIERHTLATGRVQCTGIEVPAEWSNPYAFVTAHVDLREDQLELLWLRTPGGDSARPLRLRHWREDGRLRERDVPGSTLAWDVARARLLVAGPDGRVRKTGQRPSDFTVELHDLEGSPEPIQSWTLQPEQ